MDTREESRGSGGASPSRLAHWSARDRELKDAYDAVEHHVESRYGLPVTISDVLDPNTGESNGVEIKIDLEHFYRTRKRLDFRALLREGAPILEPLDTPHFRPERWVSRYSF